MSLVRPFLAGALRQAKLRMLELFGTEAVPRLWSGGVLFGDGTTSISATGDVSP